jgi:hypothetical protein
MAQCWLYPIGQSLILVSSMVVKEGEKKEKERNRQENKKRG